MVDQSERAFRLLCQRYGVGLAYTPMIHAEPFAVDENFRRTYFDAWEAATGDTKLDRPLIAQIGGDDPKAMLKSARILETYHIDAVDVNFGCPTEDARRGGCKTHSPKCKRFGAYLLHHPDLVEKIVGTLASGLRRVPVTAKMRLLTSLEDSVEMAKRIERAGASMLCIHGRTILQRPKYADRTRPGEVEGGMAASWEAIATVRRAVSIPVIANGGVETKDDALRCLDVTGADAVMSAEALLEDPDMFSEQSERDTNEVRRRLRIAREFVDLAEAFPSALKYPPTKPHLFKMLHRLLGADQALCRQKADEGRPLTLLEEMKLVLMVCPAQNFEAIREALNKIEARYAQEPNVSLGPSWYNRWRSLSQDSQGSRGPVGTEQHRRVKATQR